MGWAAPYCAGAWTETPASSIAYLFSVFVRVAGAAPRVPTCLPKLPAYLGRVSRVDWERGALRSRAGAEINWAPLRGRGRGLGAAAGGECGGRSGMGSSVAPSSGNSELHGLAEPRPNG